MYDTELTNWWFLGKRLFIETIIESLPRRPGLTIVDVGCGTGGTTQFLTKYGTVTGVEQHPRAVKLARRRGITVREGTAEKLPILDESVDLVTIFDVLYHKRVNEHKALAEAYRILRPGGHIIITDCAIPLLWSKHDEVMEAKTRFTKHHMIRIVKSARFSPIRASYTFCSTFPLFAVQRLIARFVPTNTTAPVHPAVNALLTGLMKREQRVFMKRNLPIGSSLILHAVKPDTASK